MERASALFDASLSERAVIAAMWKGILQDEAVRQQSETRLLLARRDNLEEAEERERSEWALEAQRDLSTSHKDIRLALSTYAMAARAREAQRLRHETAEAGDRGRAGVVAEYWDEWLAATERFGEADRRRLLRREECNAWLQFIEQPHRSVLAAQVTKAALVGKLLRLCEEHRQTRLGISWSETHARDEARELWTALQRSWRQALVTRH